MTRKKIAHALLMSFVFFAHVKPSEQKIENMRGTRRAYDEQQARSRSWNILKAVGYASACVASLSTFDTFRREIKESVGTKGWSDSSNLIPYCLILGMSITMLEMGYQTWNAASAKISANMQDPQTQNKLHAKGMLRKTVENLVHATICITNGAALYTFIDLTEKTAQAHGWIHPHTLAYCFLMLGHSIAMLDSGSKVMRTST